MSKFYLILLSFLAVPGLKAQSPGGVSTNLSLWLQANNTSTLSPTTGSLNSWTYSNSTNQFTATAGSQPTVAPSTFNFLPSIAFNGSQMMLGPTGPGATGAPIAAGSLAYSIFAVWSSPAPVANGGANMRIWAQRANAGTIADGNFDGASLFVYPSGQFQGSPYLVTPSPYGDQPEIYPDVTGVSAAPAYNTAILTYTPNTPYISELNLLHQNTNDLELMDQTNYATGPGVTSTDPANNATVNRFLTDAGNFLGARSATLAPTLDEPFNGNLAELIVYDTSVSATARAQIFSYLSLKYGIPLAGSYVSSGGSTIWDAVANSSYGFNNYNYNNFVFGLGMDNASGLSTTQSNSLATGSGTGAGQSGMGNIVLSNPTALTNQGFMLVGSNNAGLTETTTNLPTLAGPGSERLATQWLVQNTGSVGNVNASFDFTGLTVTGTIGTTSDFRLVTDNDGDGNFTTGTQTYYGPSSFTGNVAQFSGINLAANSKVVFAILSNAGTGTPLPVTWVNFTAAPSGPDVDLNWTVGVNENVKDYVVQQSTDGFNFATIGGVPDQADVESYSFVQSNAGPGVHYYRIQEVDMDGTANFSKIVSVNFSSSDFALRLLNNPVTANNADAELELTTANAGNVLLQIWTLSGARVATETEVVSSGTTMIRLPIAGLAAGTYAVKLQLGNITRVVQLVIL